MAAARSKKTPIDIANVVTGKVSFKYKVEDIMYLPMWYLTWVKL